MLPGVRARPLAVLVLGLVGCSVGGGTGRVTGTLTVDECTFDSSGAPQPLPPGFVFNPTFFAAEPIDSNSVRFPANQLNIRLQLTGNRVESADVILFRVLDSAAVARCLRGSTNPDGTPEWDPAVCDRSAAALGPLGEGRLFVGMTTEAVRGFLALNNTCAQAFVSADALGACTDGSCPDLTLCPGRDSWITFSRFGTPPATGPVSPSFRINDGETIAAEPPATAPTTPMFHLALCDAATVDAKLNNNPPIHVPNILGLVEGSFSFPLERGQAGQPFP
jgi:hypothetical protein